MKTKLSTRLHIKAAVELLETVALASLLAVGADVIWVLRDILVNGLTPMMALIASLLIIATAWMAKGVYAYHIVSYKRIKKEMLETKLRNCKQTLRIKRQAKLRAVK